MNIAPGSTRWLQDVQRFLSKATADNFQIDQDFGTEGDTKEAWGSRFDESKCFRYKVEDSRGEYSKEYEKGKLVK